MRRTLVGLSMVVAGMLGTASVAAAQQPTQEPPGTPRPQPPPSGQPGTEPAPSEQVAVALEQAHEAAQSGDMNTATANMRTAANELRREANTATGDDKRMLERAARELDQTAQATSKSEGKMNLEAQKRLGRVEHDLAQYHHAKAKQSWARKDAEATGHELRAAARHVENAAKWAGVKTERGTRDVLGGVMRVSGTLVQGVGYAPKEVGRAIEDLGGEIDKVGKKVMPTKQQQ